MLNFSDFTISSEKLMISIKKDRLDIEALISSFGERRFYIGDTGIARNKLHLWANSGLMPYSSDEKDGWQKFSFIEFTWLKTIEVLRRLGIGFEQIKKLKEQLFYIDVQSFKNTFTQKAGEYNVSPAEAANVINAMNNVAITDDIWLNALESMQFSNFLIMLLSITVYNDNICIVINEENECSYVVLSGDAREKKIVNDSIVNNLINHSFTLVNLRKIVHGFIANDKIAEQGDYVIAFLTVSEKKILEKIRKGNVKEIKVLFSDNKPVQMIVVKSIGIDDAIFQMKRLLSMKGYRKIEMKLDGGKVMYYEQSDSIKLK